MSTFFKGLQKLNGIFLLLVKLTIIAVFSKLMDRVQQVFPLLSQGFFHLFCFCHLHDLLDQFPLVKNYIYSFWMNFTPCQLFIQELDRITENIRIGLICMFPLIRIFLYHCSGGAKTPLT